MNGTYLGTDDEPDLHTGSRLELPLISNREQFLIDLTRTADRVAHLGCTDAPYTKHRLAEGELLHRSLLDTGSTVVGFDIDPEAIALLREEMPDARFELVDLTSDVPAEHVGAHDLVIAGEVLEHVPNPGDFLVGAGKLLSEGGSLCVTVPNACSPKIGLRAIRGREAVHPDHFTYYGPRTIRRTLRAAGLDVEYLASYLARPGRVGQVINRGLRVAHRLYGGPVGEGLIAVARRST